MLNEYSFACRLIRNTRFDRDCYQSLENGFSTVIKIREKDTMMISKVFKLVYSKYLLGMLVLYDILAVYQSPNCTVLNKRFSPRHNIAS